MDNYFWKYCDKFSLLYFYFLSKFSKFLKISTDVRTCDLIVFLTAHYIILIFLITYQIASNLRFLKWFKKNVLNSGKANSPTPKTHVPPRERRVGETRMGGGVVEEIEGEIQGTWTHWKILSVVGRLSFLDFILYYKNLLQLLNSIHCCYFRFWASSEYGFTNHALLSHFDTPSFLDGGVKTAAKSHSLFTP